MTEELLDAAEVGPAVQQVGGEAVPERMGAGGGVEAEAEEIPLEEAADAACRKSRAAVIDEDGRLRRARRPPHGQPARRSTPRPPARSAPSRSRRPLPRTSTRPCLEIQARQVEPDQLATRGARRRRGSRTSPDRARRAASPSGSSRAGGSRPRRRAALASASAASGSAGRPPGRPRSPPAAADTGKTTEGSPGAAPPSTPHSPACRARRHTSAIGGRPRPPDQRPRPSSRTSIRRTGSSRPRSTGAYAATPAVRSPDGPGMRVWKHAWIDDPRPLRMPATGCDTHSAREIGHDVRGLRTPGAVHLLQRIGNPPARGRSLAGTTGRDRRRCLASAAGAPPGRRCPGRRGDAERVVSADHPRGGGGSRWSWTRKGREKASSRL